MRALTHFKTLQESKMFVCECDLAWLLSGI
jgi:hypothetical protein